MPNSPELPELPVDPELAAAAAAKRSIRRTRTPDIPCGKAKCEFIGRSKAELAEHLIEKHPTGVFGPEKQDEYIKLIINGEGRHSAARKVKLEPSTVARFSSLNPAFERAIVLAEEEYVERIEQKLYSAGLDGEPWAVKEVLSKRNSRRWGALPTEVNVTHTGTVTNEIEMGPQLARVQQLLDNLNARRELGAAPEIIDAEVIEDV